VPVLLEEDGAAPWPARWLSLNLPKPIPLGRSMSWAVLTLTEGTALWSLDNAPPAREADGIGPRGTSFRDASGLWLQREPPSAAGGTQAPLWALTRPRLISATPPPMPTVALRWGANRIAPSLDSRGRLALSARALEALVPPGASLNRPLEVIVSSRAPGQVVLTGLRVAISGRDDYPLFEPVP
jgi:hypothetical protein